MRLLVAGKEDVGVAMQLHAHNIAKRVVLRLQGTSPRKSATYLHILSGFPAKKCRRTCMTKVAAFVCDFSVVMESLQRGETVRKRQPSTAETMSATTLSREPRRFSRENRRGKPRARGVAKERARQSGPHQNEAQARRPPFPSPSLHAHPHGLQERVPSAVLLCGAGRKLKELVAVRRVHRAAAGREQNEGQRAATGGHRDGHRQPLCCRTRQDGITKTAGYVIWKERGGEGKDDMNGVGQAKRGRGRAGWIASSHRRGEARGAGFWRENGAQTWRVR